VSLWALAIDPVTRTTVYAGTSSGVFKSTDSAGTWLPANTGLPAEPTYVYVAVFAIDPATPSTIYAGTIGGGLFKTTDGGGSWSHTNAGANTLGVFTAVVIDPSAPATSGCRSRSRRRAERVPESFYGPELARIHHEGWEAHARALAPRVLATLRRHGIRRGRITDLGCGAGVLAEMLQRRGYEVWGVDASRAMVRLARERVPNARFVLGSVTAVALPSCEAAVAVGELVDYLRSPVEVRRVFRRVYGAVRPGGVFIFDARLPIDPRVRRVVVRQGRDWLLVAWIDEGRRRVERRIVWFRKAGQGWRRGSERHVQRIHPVGSLLAWLRTVGFRARALARGTTHVVIVARR
jgi:SAM-dependent methyltransferase